MIEPSGADRYVIETSRLSLRPVSMDDLHRLWTDPAVREFFWDGETMSRERAEAAVREGIGAFDRHGFGLWVGRTSSGSASTRLHARGGGSLRYLALALGRRLRDGSRPGDAPLRFRLGRARPQNRHRGSGERRLQARAREVRDDLRGVRAVRGPRRGVTRSATVPTVLSPHPADLDSHIHERVETRGERL